MRFFIACPANLATGGTELLHQLSWHLSNRGIENYMLYRNANPVICPTPDTFIKYQVEYVSFFVDDETSVLVCPETMIDMIHVCTKGIIIIWWLSVDNYITCYQNYINRQGEMDLFKLKEKTNLFHFAQSKYAYEFVKKNILFGAQDIFYLKDYLNDEFIRTGENYRNQLIRKNIILYNPKKGMQNLEPIKEICRKDIQWIPLAGLTPNQMAMLMCCAKIYIDFGAHPGKDRIPREAAVCGCCIITNREGSAAYLEDVGIPEKYKIVDMQNYRCVLETIYDLMDNFEKRVVEYEAYVTSILNEKNEFEREIDSMLKIIGEKCIGRYLPGEENRYATLFKSIQEMVSKMYSLYENSQKLFLHNKIDKGISELLKVESVLSVLRETNYMIIEDILTEDTQVDVD